MTSSPTPAVLPDARALLRNLEAACDDLAANRSRETYQNMVDCDRATPYLEALDDARREARAYLATPPASDAAVHIARLEAALEWALDQAASEYPHYPERTMPRTAYNAWQYPYLMSGPVQGGVCHASFQTALEAVEAAQKETRS